MNFNNIDNEEKPWANRLASWIKHNLNSKEILDIGCGPGTYVDSLREIGVNATGIDIDDRVKNKPFLKYQSLMDITNEKADTVLCMEVAEHIDKLEEDLVVKKVTSAVNKTLIWTAAAVGQGGIGHINCKNKDEWANKITKAGLVRNFVKEKQLQEFARQGSHMGWFVNNLLYFERPMKEIVNWDL
jgi:2-polyprenyl-3-methyl-5-hydroxy-6-metoxy-1,4-benzoquinol methylase